MFWEDHGHFAKTQISWVQAFACRAYVDTAGYHGGAVLQQLAEGPGTFPGAGSKRT